MKNTCKTYEENGRAYQFSHKKLLMYMNKKKYGEQLAGKKITKQAMMEELAEKLFVSAEAVKNWMYGYNGPSELEQVKSLADYFGIDYHDLLDTEEDTAMEDNKTNINLSLDPQGYCTKERVRAIFTRMVDFYNRAYFYYCTLFRAENETDEEYSGRCDTGKYELRGIFDSIEMEIRHSALDLPEAFYNLLQGYLWHEMFDVIDLVTGTMQGGYDPDDEFADWYASLEGCFDDTYEDRCMKELKELFADYCVE